MSDRKRILRALAYIEENLTERIRVGDIADEACVSMFHFSRMFNRLVGHSPYDYLMRRRLSEAAKALQQTDSKIIEIAYDYCFASPETFSRAFKRMFHCQPQEYRKAGVLDSRLLLHPVNEELIEFMESADLPAPRKIHMDSEPVLFHAGMVHVCHDPKSENWLHDVRQRIAWYASQKHEKIVIMLSLDDTGKDTSLVSVVGSLECETNNSQRFPYGRTWISEGQYAEFAPIRFKDIPVVRDYVLQVWNQRVNQRHRNLTELLLVRLYESQLDKKETTVISYMISWSEMEQ